MKKHFILFVLVFVNLISFAQPGYRIEFKAKGVPDSVAYLGYYFGEGQFYRDTAKIDKQGRFVFEGTKSLDHGIYFIAVNRPKPTKLFEPGIVVDRQQHFSMETTVDDFVRDMKVKGDPDNTIFYQNLIFNAERHKEAEPFIKIIQDSTLSEDKKKDARASFAEISKKVNAYQDDVIAKYPTSLTARLLKVTRAVEVPDPPKKADGTIDSLFQFKYYRKHYFDNFDLSDDALIRLPRPYYMEKLSDYLDKLHVQTPDSIMAAINELVTRVKKNPETYKYLVWSSMFKYQKPTIMGLDDVYVRLFDTYCETGEMDFWMSASMKKSVKEYANKIRPSLLGKTGANLIMQDPQFQPKALYDIKKKYAIVYFFDPDCGHCREESPKLVDFYTRHRDKFNLEVYAVSTDTSMKKMRDYIKEMKMTWITVNGPRSYVGSLYNLYYAETTPSMYVLDEKKKIIAKGLAAGKLQDFLSNYEKFMQRKAAVKAKGT